jgi:hypothetical protein
MKKKDEVCREYGIYWRDEKCIYLVGISEGTRPLGRPGHS